MEHNAHSHGHDSHGHHPLVPLKVYFLTIGALLGLVITFIASSSLDGIPAADDDPPTSTLRWMPSLTPLVGADNRSVPALGLTGTL